ncbi:hypothetical protein MZO42_10980 [Sphingomonas psychrotolerans]|uniref:Uncharacterized protein n=1 Tax=Sphingomonas psychrotolerans TaxID=1327635 RepID=A0ABU3N4N8_9SPHN|nr:hypothetical protein [Sphingomonas psychrotolerans]MDT8759221.1 hypothetical protein [Sphingomonas psychrotolerans]
MLKALVTTNTAQDFLRTMNTAVGRKAHLGDPAKHQVVLNSITAAHTAIEGGVETLARLADDPTRSEPEKHDAARVIATRTIEALERSRANIGANATKIEREATEAIEAQFAPNPNRAGIESEIRDWVRERAKAGDVAAIKEEAKRTPEVAAVLYHSPRFLLGLAKETHESFVIDAIETHAPKQYAAITESGELMRLAERYSPIIKSVRSSFYNQALADTAKRRVEV